MWGETELRTLEDLKGALTAQTTLRGTNFIRQLVLQTDASEVGLGAVLSQLDEQGGEHPIAFYSWKLLPRRRISLQSRKNAWQ